MCAQAVANNDVAGCANRYTGEIINNYPNCGCASKYICVDDNSSDSNCSYGSYSHQQVLNQICPQICYNAYQHSVSIQANGGPTQGQYFLLGDYKFVYNGKVYKWINQHVNKCSNSTKYGSCAYLGGNDFAFWVPSSNSCCCKAEYIQDY